METPVYQWIPALADLIAEIPPDSILSRTIHNDEHANVTLFGFAAGQSLSEHMASQPAIIHALSGEAEITLDGDAKAAQPGAWIYMPPRLPHSIHAKTDFVMLLILLRP